MMTRGLRVIEGYNALPAFGPINRLQVGDTGPAESTRQGNLQRVGLLFLGSRDSLSFLCVGGILLARLGEGGGTKISISLFQYNPITTLRASVNWCTLILINNIGRYVHYSTCLYTAYEINLTQYVPTPIECRAECSSFLQSTDNSSKPKNIN